MKRRRTASRKPAKTRHRKTTKPKRSTASVAAHRASSSVAELQKQLERQARELDEAREQQTATSDVLRIISSSPGELEPVFQAMLENAVRICDATFGNIYRWDGESLRLAATHNTPPAFAEARRRSPIRPDSKTFTARVLRTRTVLHIADITADELYSERGDLTTVAGFVEATGARSMVVVPMLKEQELIGVISIYRQEARPFTDKQIAVVSNFAAQAVIAVENARLLNELRQSLGRQTATSEVLGVISRSKFELQPILQSVVDTAARLCRAEAAVIFRQDANLYRFAAGYSLDPAYLEIERQTPIAPGYGSVVGRAVLTRQVARIHDAMTDELYEQKGQAQIANYRSMIGVPLMREGEPIGAIGLARKHVEPFSDREIELVATFADQAVIAIENVRLFEAEQQRTRELTESLEQQTATADVLRVISSSPGHLQPVFDRVLANATRLCGGNFGWLSLYEGEGLFRVGARHNVPASYLAWAQRFPPTFRAHPSTPLMRAAATKKPVQTHDYAEEQSYKERDLLAVAMVELGGVRSLAVVPMLKDEELIGAISIFRQEVRPFTDKQIELVKNFAAQAVIAIENARLLNELRQSLQQQTATADVLKIISRSTFNLQTVLDILVESAARLSEADMSAIVRLKGSAYEHAASYGLASELHEYMQNFRLERGRATVAGRVALEGQVVQVVDIEADSDYVLVDAMRRAGTRTILGAPLLREGLPIGVIVLMRKSVRPFTDKQIELVTTFADQAVIAIENVRLFDEIREKSQQLEVASKHKSQFLANMSHELRTPLNAILGYTELILDSIYGEAPEKMRDVLERVQTNGKHLLGLINDVLDLSKIEAGQLTLSLTDYSLAELVQGVYVAVEPLAAQKKLALTTNIAKGLPVGHGDERRLAQVLLNLVGNAIKFTEKGEVAIKASCSDGAFRVAVRDSGPGIADTDQGKIFEEFQQADNTQTKTKGGTGLGLAISKRIIEMHGGRIWVDSAIGQGSTFTFTVPIHVAQQVEPA